MNKIVSNFYLIVLSGEPVYVGYTNRPINTRFSEHKRQKDFGDIEPAIENLGKLEYNFTWDLELINKYAKEVSDRETELIEKYGTQDSVWQKGVNGNTGGQTWANVKSFVKTNRDNPAFREMNESDIMMLLEWQRRSSQKLQDMINNTRIKGAQKIRDIINHTYVKGYKKLNNVTNNTNVKGAQKLRGIVNDTGIKGSRKLKDMVNHTDFKGGVKLKDMVNKTSIKGSRKLQNTVNGTYVKGLRKLKGMVSITNVKGAQKLRDMVNNTKSKVLT